MRARSALVIPAWNEAESIGAVLSEIPPDVVDQVFVVVGVSTDATAEIAARSGAQPLRTDRPGYGLACWTGARAALADGAQVVAFLDGDYADPPAALPWLMARVLEGSADLALGWRNMQASPAALPLHARLGNAGVLLDLRLLVGVHWRDLPSFKVIHADALQALEMQEMSYGWTVEMLVKSARLGLRIAEIPVAYRHRLGGRSKVSGTLRGTVGAAWKLCSCAVRYARWSPHPLDRPLEQAA
jgi:glycosyltransferase involved in cell wall biosynthesis